MHVYEWNASDGRWNAAFETAVYRFLELSPVPDDCSVSVHTEVRPAGCVRSVHLWSSGAVADFNRFWREFQEDLSASGAASLPARGGHRPRGTVDKFEQM